MGNYWGYNIFEHVADGFVRISSFVGLQLWCLTNTNVRKNHDCSLCDILIKKGQEQMYRPITNGHNRMDRICKSCIEKAA